MLSDGRKSELAWSAILPDSPMETQEDLKHIAGTPCCTVHSGPSSRSSESLVSTEVYPQSSSHMGVELPLAPFPQNQYESLENSLLSP